MDSQNSLDSVEDDRIQQSRHSYRSNRRDSRSTLTSRKQDGNIRKNAKSSGDRAQTRTLETDLHQDRDQDQDSDRGHSTASFYSDDYENVSASEKSFSPRSPTPSPPRGGRTRRVTSQTGVRKVAARRTGPQAPRPRPPRSSGLRSHSLSKEAPPKDVDLVTKRLLSARLLKISELQNALAESQQHGEELQRENRLLRQLQLRHEKALHRYSDAEGEIAQLISRHNNETHVLRERLRRAQGKERAAERGHRDADAQLQRCQDQLHKLQQLANDHNLGERDELTRKLAQTQARVQESERRVKELEKNMELSNGSFQRQLATERRKTHEALQEVRTLQEEVERLSSKLKEREKELDARNIYANRMVKAVSKKEADNAKRKGSRSGNSSKAVQTEDRTLSLDFPSPPPAITDGSEIPPDDQADNYLSLKIHQPAPNPNYRKQDLQSNQQTQSEVEECRILEMERVREKERAKARERELVFEKEREKEKLRERDQELEKVKEKPKAEAQRKDQKHSPTGMRQKDGHHREEEDTKRWTQVQNAEEKTTVYNHDQDNQWMREQEIQVNEERAEEERQRKEQLLAKMREIDMQFQGQSSNFFSDQASSVHSPPQSSDPLQHNHNHSKSIFKFTEPDESVIAPGVYKRGAVLQTQRSSQDLDFAFGSYTPSFGKPAPRAGLGVRNSSQTLNQSPAEENEGLRQTGLVKERKSDLMQQLFGSSSTPTDPSSGKSDSINSSGAAKSPPKASSGRKKDTELPSWLNNSNVSNSSTVHISKTHPIVRAITSFDDEIEEVTL